VHRVRVHDRDAQADPPGAGGQCPGQHRRGAQEQVVGEPQLVEPGLLGRAGQAIEPAVAPLGWDWRIGVAALASFPAREVVVGTLGIIYQAGDVKPDDIREAENAGETDLGKKLKEATWDNSDRPVFTVPAALSLMVFFALCCQCASTLAVIKRETNSWRWPIFTFTYMTVLAYVGAWATYHVGMMFIS